MGRIGRALKRGFKKFTGFVTNVNKKVSQGLRKIPGIGKVVDKIPLMGTIVKAADKINDKVNDWSNK